MKYVVISDSHISPTCPNVRDWRKLGEYCVKHRIDYIIHLGDVADLDSLAWLKASRGNYTTEEELATVAKHLNAFEEVIQDEQAKNRRQHMTIYRPKKVLCLGNHDVRNGYTGIQDLFVSKDWIVKGYLEQCNINGMNFAHCMMKGLSDVPCTTAQELLENWHSTCIVGHSHIRDYAESFSLELNDKIYAIKCPVFNNNDTGWAVQTRQKWSRGFTEIDDTDYFSFVWRPIECLYQ